MINILDRCIREKKSIMIYGAGIRGKRLLALLDGGGLKDLVSCFVVSDREGNPDEIEGILVRELSVICENRDTENCNENCAESCVSDGKAASIRESYIIVALADREAAVEVEATLRNKGFENVAYFSQDAYELPDYLLAKRYLESLDKRVTVVKKEYDEFGFCHATIDDLYQWRFYYTKLKTMVKVKEEFFPKGKLLEEYEDLYGKYRPLKLEMSHPKDFESSPEQNPDNSAGYTSKETIGELKTTGKTNPNIKIFRALGSFDRAPLKLYPQPFVTNIQLGAALTDERIKPDTKACDGKTTIVDGKDIDDSCIITDNTGDNISELNRDFCECTALYWIWKNVKDADYVGLFHYARYIDISKEELDNLSAAGVDIVLTTPMMVGAPIKEFFCPRYIPGKDWRLMEESLISLYPEYEKTLEKYNKAFCYPGANLSIMRKEIFDEYAEFAFNVALDVHERYKKEGVNRQDRYAGYIMENLLALFAMHNKDRFRIATCDFLFAKEYV